MKARALVIAGVVAAAAGIGVACSSLKSPDDVADGARDASEATVDGPSEGGDGEAGREAGVDGAVDARGDGALDSAADAATIPDAPADCSPLAPPTITEFAVTSTAGAGPSSIVLGPDGNMWFTLNAAFGSTNANTGNALGRISPDGSTQTSFALPTAGSGPADLVVGPDGNIWFTEFRVGQVGHIAPDGTGAVEYTLPATGSQPNGIAVGPDGKIWFTDLGANSVGWIPVTGGQATEIPLPEGNSFPAGILAGPDGDVWFAEQRGNRIAKIATTAGATPTEYTIPTTVNPHGLTFGPDGNVWFAEYGATGIGRMTLDGGFAEFPAGASSWRIVSGPDGNLWFTENGAASMIGRITPNGTVSAWPVTANSSVTGIASGPHVTGGATVWFTEQASDKIGRVTICVGGVLVPLSVWAAPPGAPPRHPPSPGMQVLGISSGAREHTSCCRARGRLAKRPGAPS